MTARFLQESEVCLLCLKTWPQISKILLIYYGVNLCPTLQ